MRKDINIPKVEDIGMAIVSEKNDAGAEEWHVYLLNMKDEPIKNTLINSKGYGNQDGKQVKTSSLRHFFEEIPAKSPVKVEMITDEVFGLHNEYWVSFYIGDVIYDKRYVFLAESIQEGNFSSIPLLEKPGVLIK